MTNKTIYVINNEPIQFGPDPDLMAGEIAAAKALGHKMGEFIFGEDSLDQNCWTATCSVCNKDVAMWASGVKYSILDDTCPASNSENQELAG